jgi:hypothetical protein
MNSPHLARFAILGLCVAIAFLTGWTKKGKLMKSELAAVPMRTVCVGRFLIDIPKTAEISFGSARIGGWDVSAPIDESKEAFFKRLSAREHELQSMMNRQLVPTLEATREIRTDDLVGKVFVFDRIRNYSIVSGQRVYGEAVSFQSMMHSMGRSFELSADLRPEDSLTRKTKVAAQFVPWSFDRIPEVPGFCMGEAFVHEPLSIDDREFVMMYIGMKEHPDLAIAISTWAGINLDAPLLERERNNSIKQEYASRFKDLGTGERTINGIRGGQLADEVAEPNGTTGFSFQWESAMEKTNVLRPRILLELDTGKGRPGHPVNSSLSKPAVLALWNKVSSSIRDRPHNISAQMSSGKGKIQ